MNENFNNLKLKTSNERCIGNCTDYRDKSIFELFSCSVLHFEHLIMDDVLGISEDEKRSAIFPRNTSIRVNSIVCSNLYRSRLLLLTMNRSTRKKPNFHTLRSYNNGLGIRKSLMKRRIDRRTGQKK